jgi:hypothetical protein
MMGQTRAEAGSVSMNDRRPQIGGTSGSDDDSIRIHPCLAIALTTLSSMWLRVQLRSTSSRREGDEADEVCAGPHLGFSVARFPRFVPKSPISPSGLSLTLKLLRRLLMGRFRYLIPD